MQTSHISIENLLNSPLFTIAGKQISLTTLVIFALIVLLTWAVSYALRGAIERGFHMRGLGDTGTVGIAKRLTHYTVMAIGIAVALDTVGINLTALLTAGAVFGVAIGFAMQNIAQNFVSGVILLIERTIKPGDILQVENEVVRVVTMGLRSTIARTRGEEELIIPNSTLVQSTVTNFTLRDSLFRVQASVGVAYESDLKLVRETLESAAGALDWRDKSRDPRVLLSAFGDSSVNYDVYVWVDDPWSAPLRRSQLMESIWWALKDRDIVIAFPQVDVHFDPDVQSGLSTLRPAS